MQSSKDDTDNICHSLTIEEVLELLQTTSHGLTSDEGFRRLQKTGCNELAHKSKSTLSRLFPYCLRNYLILILLCAILISILIENQ